jgi:hypothetical protein
VYALAIESAIFGPSISVLFMRQGPGVCLLVLVIAASNC